MSNLPERPKFITSITWIQKTLAGIAGTSFLMSLLTLVPWIESSLFSKDALFVSELRKWMAGMALITGCFVGVPQIKYLVSYIFDILEFYQKFQDIKVKERDKEIEAEIKTKHK